MTAAPRIGCAGSGPLPEMTGPEQLEATLPLPNALAYAIAAIALVVAVAQPFALAAGGLSLPEAVEEYYLQSHVLYGLLGALILRRRPGHVIGWALVGIGAFDAVAHLGEQYVLFGLGELPGYPPAGTIIALTDWTWVPATAGIVIVLPQLFPDGRLLTRRWRPLAVFGAAATTLLAVLFLLDPDATGAAFAVAFPLYGVAALASMIPLTLRYRRSRGIERQQLKWVFFGVAVSLPLFVLSTTGVFFGAASAAWAIPTMVILPATITVAVLRYRLFDIDVVISKALLVAGLAGFITVAYVAIVVGIGSLVGGDTEPDLALSLVATAVVAVAFQPVRLRLQRVANRLVYGHRATPYDVLSGFATRVGAAEPSPDTLERLAELLADGTGGDPARVWLRVGTQLRPAATWPQRQADTPAAVDAGPDADPDATPTLPDADLAVPVRDRGELLGVLTIAKPRGERVTDPDIDLVGRLATASGVVLRNVALDAGLTQRLVDLEAARRRLYTAQDDARQRIEADLAGGSRAQLSTLRELLAVLLREADPAATPTTAALLRQLVTQADGALDTLAGLAAGVYPPRLACDGLATALTEQATKTAVPVSVHTSGVGRYPRDVEAAVYFSVLEVVANVAKYADATSAQVRLRHDGDRLSFEVTDDGVGFDPTAISLGTGLAGVGDRLDTVGGTMTIRSTPGAGTTITGQVPAETTPVEAPALARAAR